MLGYVQIDKGELKVREYEVYTGYYCGICKSIGSRYGQLPRMTLSYDAAFLAILLDSLADVPDHPLAEHCIGHHIKKKTVIRSGAVDYAGDVMLILAWFKLLDDIQDEGKSVSKAASVVFKGLYKKLYAYYPTLCDSISAHMQSLSALEREKCSNIDAVGEEFSSIMEAIFTEGFYRLYDDSIAIHSPGFICRDSVPGGYDDTSDDAPSLSVDSFCEMPHSAVDTLSIMGFHLGKWIYLIDAADDINENAESGAYNPLFFRFDFNPARESCAEFRKRIADNLSFNLYHYLAALCDSFSQLDIKKNKGIMENILYFGLNRKTEEILKGDTNESV